jgi:hypothetical protein
METIGSFDANTRLPHCWSAFGTANNHETRDSRRRSDQWKIRTPKTVKKSSRKSKLSDEAETA